MFRPQALVFASLVLSVGCASSSSQGNVNNPDAGAVQYDVGSADAGASGAAGDADGGAADEAAGGEARKGKDQTGTRGVGVPKKTVKKLAAAKPPRDDTAEPEKPKRKGRQPSPNGLLVEYFKIEAATADLPDFATLAGPASYAIAPSVDIASGSPFPGSASSLGQNFAARFTGSLNVVSAAEYNLCLNSSDGAQLLLDGAVVVDNGGAHEAKQACELVYMDPGEYEVAILYFNVGEDAVLQWTWDAGGAGAVAVPSASLFKPAGADDKLKTKPR